MVGNLIHRKTDNTIIKKDKQWLATSYTEKQTIQLSKKTNNGWQHHTQKHRQYNYKKRQTIVGNLIHRKTDNTIIKKDKQWSAS